jgi:hypothetical protein
MHTLKIGLGCRKCVSGAVESNLLYIFCCYVLRDAPSVAVGGF